MPEDRFARIESEFPDEVRAAKDCAKQQAAALARLNDLHAGASMALVKPASDRVPGDADAGLASASVFSPPAEDCWSWSLAAIASAFADQRLDPAEFLHRSLDRIERLDPQLNSFVLVDRTGANAAACQSAARWRARAPLSQLDGIPVAIKDVIDVAGLPTRCQSRTTRDVPAQRDAAIVARLRSAGCVILGKLATHEYAIGGPVFDLPFPPARNPWNLAHHPGGSSSGAGAAVAARLVPLAVGTDTAGSVRHPASACGIVGLKPGRNVLPLDGIVPLARTLDHVGLLTRSVADMTLAARVAGISVEPAPVGLVGYVRHFHVRDMIATSETCRALDRAAATLRAVDVELPALGDFALVNRLILQSEGYREHGHHLRSRPADLSYLTRAALLPGAFTTGDILESAMAARQALGEVVDGLFSNVDLLLTASSMEPPCRICDKPEIARTYMLQARTPFNVTGHPALTMFAGISADGLPLSLQLVARRGEEGRLLAAAASLAAVLGEAPAPPIA